MLAVAATFKRVPRLSFVSGSALADALTNGAIPNFFRVVPKEAAQAPAIARLIRRSLKAEQVVVVGDGSAYSRRLADAVHARLQAGGVRVRRAAAPAGVGKGTDVVFLPWRVAADAQLFGLELRKQGKQAVLVGSDGLDSGDFTIPGSYVSAFAPDVRGIEGNVTFIEGYGAPFLSRFGPPVYVATQAAIAAIRKACADGEATRAEVQKHLRATFIRRIVLGGSLRFTRRGDREGAKFSLYKLGLRGKRMLVG